MHNLRFSFGLKHKKYSCLFIALRETFSEHKILGVVSLIGIMPF